MKASRKLLVVLALVAGLLAVQAAEPLPAADADEVKAETLAGWIRQQRAGLRVLDVRPAEAVNAGALPGAQAVADLDAAALADIDTVVLAAAGEIDTATAAAMRQRWPQVAVLRLHAGLAAWNDAVMFPAIRADASARQHAAFAERAALSRYFGGAPRVLDAAAQSPAKRSRQGC